ncbi:MAG: S49 family peptidase [Parvibaculum sp.]|uniref:S49 family peptidase n=1 Tax=Parvibaculum sp. TaxID=2024848 RepID=UPI003C741304
MKNLIAPLLPSPLRRRAFPNYTSPAVVAVVRLNGVIGAVSPLRGGIDLASVAGALEAAFTMKGVKAVALSINSPGGSPVQSSLIYKRVRALAAEKTLPVFAFAEDVAASGGYMLACAADEIYADESSIIGSIGVVSAGFGFTGLIDKLGVERRVHTSGESKSMLDPFKPENPDDVERLKALQHDVHENFKSLVRRARGERLAEPSDGLFTGEFWAASGALSRGLIDGVGDLRSVMRERFGKEVRLKLVGGKKPFWRRGIGLTSASASFAEPSHLGEGFAQGLLGALETRSIWNRFGL